MTTYYVRIANDLFRGSEFRLPPELKFGRVLRSDEDISEVEVEDAEADSSFEGRTVTLWLQETVDGGVVVMNREIMNLPENQVQP